MPNSCAHHAGPSYQGQIENQVALARYTSWRVGGNAEQLYRPVDLSDLGHFLRQLPKTQAVTWLGLGSNVLIRDGGIKGVVILTSGRLNEITLVNGQLLRVEAGVACAKVARFCAKHHLKGAEFLAGIPGTFGGALWMNAGAFGGETWDLVDELEVMHRNGLIERQGRDAFIVKYRTVEGLQTGQWFSAAYLRLEKGESAASLQGIKALLKQRNETQPIGLPSCGSVFKNPPSQYAARLIEQSGLKGFSIGQAQVSTKHANFIVNKGQATATDIEQLIEHIQSVVKAQTGVMLEREVIILGEKTNM